MCSHASVLVESLMTSSAPLPRQVLNWHYLPKASVGSLLLCLSYSPLQSESEVTQSCPTLCDPMDCSLSGSSVHEIFQARVLDWIVISFSRGSSRPRNRTRVSHIAGRRFTIWAATYESTNALRRKLHHVHLWAPFARVRTLKSLLL